MDPLEKKILDLATGHEKLRYDFDYHKKEFEEVKGKLIDLNTSLSEILQSLKMIKYVITGAVAMYALQSTGSFSHFLKVLAGL